MVISGILIIESTVLTATVFEARAESLLYCTENSTVLAATGQAAWITLVTNSSWEGRMNSRHTTNSAGATSSRRAAILYTAKSETKDCKSTLAT